MTSKTEHFRRTDHKCFIKFEVLARNPGQLRALFYGFSVQFLKDKRLDGLLAVEVTCLKIRELLILADISELV